jgi:YVTN family beta-propeller protein
MKYLCSYVALVVGLPLTALCAGAAAQHAAPIGKTIRAYITNFGGDGISVIDPEGGRLVAHVRTGAKPHGVAIAPDGSAVYVSNEGDGTVSIVDPRRNQVTHTIEVGKDPNRVGFTPDGRRAVIGNTGSNDISVVDVSSQKVVATVPVGQSPKRLAVGAVDTRSETSGATSMRWTFDDIAAGTLAKGWRAEGTNQRGPVATWVVKADSDAPSKPNVLALTDAKEGAGGTFNLCWTDGVKFRDGAIEVRVKAGTGREDQGGGPIWRVQDNDNYYIARWNPLEDNFRLYYVKDGSRKMVGTAGVKADPAKWHTIRIEQNGDRIRCSLDGETLFEVNDKTFPKAGGVGVWTKADAVTSFDDLIVSGAP